MQIIYATDGSSGAVSVAEILCRLTLTAADRILLLGVAAPGGTIDEERLFGEARRALVSSAVVETEVRRGTAAEQIIDCARELGADLIAVGATGLTGLARFFIGSVAERVLRHAETDVLVARPIQHGLRRAIVGVDPSDVGRAVAAAAGRLPLPAETDLRLATVLPPQASVVGVAPLVLAPLTGDIEAVLKAAVDDASNRLRELARPIQELRENVSAEVLRGDPASSLISAAQSQEADLLIVGSHGEGGVDRFLLGSVSERVARHAPCSVIVIR